MDVRMKWVRGHVEVYDRTGRFLFSADSESEALRELEEAAKAGQRARPSQNGRALFLGAFGPWADGAAEKDASRRPFFLPPAAGPDVVEDISHNEDIPTQVEPHQQDDDGC